MGQKPSVQPNSTPSVAFSVANWSRHRWISLPDDLIVDIISRLGFPREAVITVSATDFIIRHINTPTYDVHKFWTTLDNLFTVFITPNFDTFCLDLNIDHYREPRCWPIIDRWARQLRACNIQRFTANTLSHYRSDDHVYPQSIFQMHSLVSLELNLCPRIAWSTPNNSIHLPNLMILSLYRINYKCLRRVLSCCPSLEYLFLAVNEPKKRLLSLTSKKLKLLCITDLKGSSVVDVIIDAPMLHRLDYSSDSILSMRMLASISNVNSLELKGGSRRIGPCPKKKIVLPNLTRLQLVTCSAEIFKAIGLMLHCPKLEVFGLHLDSLNKMVWNQEAVFVPVEHVKLIKLYASANVDQFGKEMLDLVRFLLRSAKVLEKLSLFAQDPCNNRIYWDKLRFY